MLKKLMKLILGVILSSFGITCVIHANLGVFPITAANIAVANWLGVSIGISGMLVELAILGLAVYLGEGVSLTGIVNATLGSLLIDFWNPILPSHPIMVFGILLLPLAWYLSSSIGLGDTNQNLLTNGIIKESIVNPVVLKWKTVNINKELLGVVVPIEFDGQKYIKLNKDAITTF